MDATPINVTTAAKPIAFASVPEKPVSAERAHVAKDAKAVFQSFKTTIRLYVQMTGAELGLFSGTSDEIRGNITATPAFGSTETRYVNVDLPEKTNFAGENGGLGRMVAELTKTTIFVPPNFSGVLYEEGNMTTGNRFFTNFSVDWNTAPPEWADGRWWYSTQTVSNDANYIGHLWWQVTQN